MATATVLPGEKIPLSEESPSSIDIPTSVPRVIEEVRPELQSPPAKEKKYFVTEEEIQKKIARANALSSQGTPLTDEAVQEKIARANEASSEMTINKGAGIISAGMADLMDMPYDAFMTVVNAALTGTGLDKFTGTVQTDNFRRFADAYGISLPEGKMPEGVLKEALYFIGQGIVSLPMSAPLLARIPAGALNIAFSRFGGKNAKSIQNQFLGGKWPTHLKLPPPLKQIFGKDKIRLLPKEKKAVPLTTLERIKPKEALKTAIHTMGQTAIRGPKSYATWEVLASGGAGVGYGIAKEYTDSPTGQLFGGLVGGVTPGTTVALIKSLGGKGLKIAWDSIRSITPLDARPRSVRRLEELITDKDKVLKNIKGKAEEKILPEIEAAMTPIQKARAGSSIEEPQVIRELLPLEKSILDSAPYLRQLGDKQHAELNDLLIRAMSTPAQGDIKLTKREFQLQRNLFMETVIARFKLAKLRADETIKKMGPDLDRKAANKIAREELEAALKDMKDQEDKMWAMVDDTVTLKKDTGRHFESDEEGVLFEVITNPLINAWKKLLKEKTRIDDPSDFLFSGQGSKDLYKELGYYNEKGNWIKGRMKQNETLKILQVLRSRMLEELRGEKAKLNSGNKRRIFGKLQKSILKMFEAEEHTINMKVNPETGEFTATQPERQLLKALAVSRMLNDKFNKGEISKILGSNRDGSFKTDEALTLKELIGKNIDGEQRGVTLEKVFIAIEREKRIAANFALTRTAGEVDPDPLSITPVTIAVKNYIKHLFFNEFVFEGEIARKSAIKWITDNREVLKQIPGLKKEFDEVIKTGNTASLRESQYKKARELIYSPERSIAIYLSEYDPIALFNREGQFTNLTEKQFINQINKTLKKASKDRSGGATKGVQQSVFDWVLQNSKLIGTEGSKNISATQQDIFSGFKMGRILSDPKNEYIFSKILTPVQRERLDLIYRSAKEIDAIRHTEGLPGGKIMSDTVGWLLQSLGKIGGADIGRRISKFMGGGTIQTPGVVSGRLGNFMKGLTRDYAKEMLIKAATSDDPELFIALVKRIQTLSDEKYVSKQLNAYIAELLAEDNIPFPKEDFYGIMEGEFMEQPQ